MLCCSSDDVDTVEEVRTIEKAKVVPIQATVVQTVPKEVVTQVNEVGTGVTDLVKKVKRLETKLNLILERADWGAPPEPGRSRRQAAQLDPSGDELEPEPVPDMEREERDLNSAGAETGKAKRDENGGDDDTDDDDDDDDDDADDDDEDGDDEDASKREDGGVDALSDTSAPVFADGSSAK
ncbi:phosphopantothenoylcysteine decarboxylase subunit VHS3-like [Pollicipes pollicipes]|uniref:phosphopantothenoylcysteine decarboxylase subunit VHS3-like n=1 Tax=Pollicipes pollicipes TaxID=41117 RepID=UPI00188578D7|nr:phosphopantothenoylcysteine decarboxylase subunit VHS3-like [Pollicipes pollicipes]